MNALSESAGYPTILFTHANAKEELFDYIEIFYNQQRRHSALDYVSPAEYEKASQVRQAAWSNCLPERGNSTLRHSEHMS